MVISRFAAGLKYWQLVSSFAARGARAFFLLFGVKNAQNTYQKS